jgi:hypothetical protein
MRYLNFYLAILSLSVVFACSKDGDLSSTNENLKKGQPFESKIVGFTSNGEFSAIEEEQYHHYLINHVLELPKSSKGQQISTELKQEEGAAWLLTKLIIGQSSYAVKQKLILDQGKFHLTGETCTCESTNCTFGCELLSGPGCNCSSCSNRGAECKKTHKRTSGDLSLTHFQIP